MKQSMKSASLAVGLLGIPLLSGCGGSSKSSSPALLTPQPRSVSATTANGLTATLAENADAISRGGSVTYTVTLTNPTSQPVSFQLTSCSNVGLSSTAPDAFLSVTDASGAVVYPTGPFPEYPCGPVSPITQTLTAGQTLNSQFTVSGQGSIVSGQYGLAQPFSTTGTYTASATVITSVTGSSTVVGPLTLIVQ